MAAGLVYGLAEARCVIKKWETGSNRDNGDKPSRN